MEEHDPSPATATNRSSRGTSPSGWFHWAFQRLPLSSATAAASSSSLPSSPHHHPRHHNHHHHHMSSAVLMTPTDQLIALIRQRHWDAVRQRLVTHPRDAQYMEPLFDDNDDDDSDIQENQDEDDGDGGRFVTISTQTVTAATTATSTALHVALLYRAPHDIVARLIDLFPAALHITDGDGWLPLHLNLLYTSPDGDRTPLLLIRRTGHQNSPPPPNTSSRPDYRRSSSSTTTEAASLNLVGSPLHLACRHGASLSVIRELLRIDSSQVKQRNAAGMTPATLLWNACMRQQQQQDPAVAANNNDINRDSNIITPQQYQHYCQVLDILDSMIAAVEGKAIITNDIVADSNNNSNAANKNTTFTSGEISTGRRLTEQAKGTATTETSVECDNLHVRGGARERHGEKRRQACLRKVLAFQHKYADETDFVRLYLQIHPDAPQYPCQLSNCCSGTTAATVNNCSTSCSGSSSCLSSRSDIKGGNAEKESFDVDMMDMDTGEEHEGEIKKRKLSTTEEDLIHGGTVNSSDGSVDLPLHTAAALTFKPSSSSNLPASLHFLLKPHQIIHDPLVQVLDAYPSAAARPDSRGRMPLVIALDEGKRGWFMSLQQQQQPPQQQRNNSRGTNTPSLSPVSALDGGIAHLLQAYPASVTRRDPQTALYPLQVAAAALAAAASAASTSPSSSTTTASNSRDHRERSRVGNHMVSMAAPHAESTLFHLAVAWPHQMARVVADPPIA